MAIQHIHAREFQLAYWALEPLAWVVSLAVTQIGGPAGVLPTALLAHGDVWLITHGAGEE